MGGCGEVCGGVGAAGVTGGASPAAATGCSPRRRLALLRGVLEIRKMLPSRRRQRDARHEGAWRCCERACRWSCRANGSLTSLLCVVLQTLLHEWHIALSRPLSLPPPLPLPLIPCVCVPRHVTLTRFLDPSSRPVALHVNGMAIPLGTRRCTRTGCSTAGWWRGCSRREGPVGRRWRPGPGPGRGRGEGRGEGAVRCSTAWWLLWFLSGAFPPFVGATTTPALPCGAP